MSYFICSWTLKCVPTVQCMSNTAFQFADFQYLKVQIPLLEAQLTIKKRHYLWSPVIGW
jgi:hypothetical protein